MKKLFKNKYNVPINSDVLWHFWEGSPSVKESVTTTSMKTSDTPKQRAMVMAKMLGYDMDCERHGRNTRIIEDVIRIYEYLDRGEKVENDLLHEIRLTDSC